MSKALKILFFISLAGIAIAFFWDNIPFVKNSVEGILNPTAGNLLDWNINYGMIIIVGIIMLIITLLQKYTTDNELLREIKQEQKMLNEEMKKYKDNPEKILELNKKSLELIPKTLDVTMRPTLFTFIPIILFFRWFGDYFAQHSVKIFGFFSWFWAYLIFSIVFSIIYRKLFKLP